MLGVYVTTASIYYLYYYVDVKIKVWVFVCVCALCGDIELLFVRHPSLSLSVGVFYILVFAYGCVWCGLPHQLYYYNICLHRINKCMCTVY